MPLVVKDRVLETTSSTGTGTITLGGAVAGYQSFSVIGNGNTTYYTISGGSEWEVGIGTYTSSGTTLSRDTVLESSNGGSLVNFSAGTKNVFVTYPAEKSVDLDTAQTLTNKIISGASNTLSNIGNSSLTNSAITINGTSTSLGGSINVGTVTSVTGTAPVVSSGGNTPAISMAQANSTTNGYLSSTDWNTFNNKGSGTVTSVSAGNGMSFTTITGSGSVTMGTPSNISNSSTNSVSAGTHTHALSGELVEVTTGSPLYYGARCWINFNGTAATIGTGRASVNVSSVTDGGAGNYTVNFSTAMPDADYATVIAGQANDTTNARYATLGSNAGTYSTSGVTVKFIQQGNSALADALIYCVAVFR